MRLPRSSSQIGADVQHVLSRNSLDDAVVRVTVSRGRGRRGPGIEGADAPTYVLSAEPLPGNLGERQAHGLRLRLSSVRRVSPNALPASAKHANYLNAILAYDEAVRAGADEALMLDANERIGECSTANIFFVRKSCVCTPSLSAGILGGITRALVLDLASGAGLEIDQSLFEMDALLDAEEVFVTSSVMGVCPVQSVDARGHITPQKYAAPGPVTRQLLGLYRDKIREGTSGSH